MHFFLYEFVTGGGWLFVEPEDKPQGSLLREGLAMISALVEDFAALEESCVTILWDARLPLPQPLERMRSCRVRLVHSIGEHDELLAKVAASADYTVLIAPEFGGHLLRVGRLAADAGARLLCPQRELVELASDKHLTALHLAQHGVPTPLGVALAPGERLPVDFPCPAVVKPRDGAGSLDVQLIATNEEAHTALPRGFPARLEQLVVGTPVSVAVLCGRAENILLPALRQNLSSDGKFTYLGGDNYLSPDACERAHALARRTMEALPPTIGYLGMDMMLGPDVAGDTVIEINPRLTTSCVGLRAVLAENLAGAMLQVAAGQRPTLSRRDVRLRFTAAGEVAIENF